MAAERGYMEKVIQGINEPFSAYEMQFGDFVKQYYFIKGYATGRGWFNTLMALPMGRHLHAGQTRRETANMNGERVRKPYYCHCMAVCSSLIAPDFPLPDEKMDILCAAALLHDTIEDCNVGADGKVLLDRGVSQEVVDIIKCLSKPSGATEYELSVYFNNIKKNPLALLIKIADRKNNTDTIYTFKTPQKLEGYIEETEKWVLPLCTYGKENYPYLSNGITILKSGIKTNISTIRAVMEGMSSFIIVDTEHGAGGAANDKKENSDGDATAESERHSGDGIDCDERESEQPNIISAPFLD